MAKQTKRTDKATSELKPIGGKLGIVAMAIGTPKGATLEQLEKKTGWQPHTIRAALSRLRKKDMIILLSDVDGRKAYRSPATAK